MYDLTPILPTVPADLGAHGYIQPARVVKAYTMTPKRAIKDRLSHAGAWAAMGLCVVELRMGDTLDTSGTFQQVLLPKGKSLKRGDRVSQCWRRVSVPGWGKLVGLVRAPV